MRKTYLTFLDTIIAHSFCHICHNFINCDKNYQKETSAVINSDSLVLGCVGESLFFYFSLSAHS